MANVLFCNTSSIQCGIYQFGYNIGKSLLEHKSQSNTYYYIQPKTLLDFEKSKLITKADVVIINYVHGLFPWLVTYKPTDLCKYLDILHERDLVYQKSFFNNYFFHKTLHANPFSELGTKVIPLPRLLPQFNLIPYNLKPSVVRVGASGFGMLNRGWLEIIDRVQDEFDAAEIEFQMPFNSVVDVHGTTYALKTAELCRRKVLKPGVSLKINHNFLSTESLIEWLGQNTINLCLYQENQKRGISSAIDFALSAKRPIGINSSPMYDHLSDIRDLISVESNKLIDIINRGIEPLKPFYEKWNSNSFFNTFDSIINFIS